MLLILACAVLPAGSAAATAASATTTFDLCNQNGTAYGVVRVGDDGGIWIQYALSDTWIGRGWVITQVDYAVGDELSDIPVTKYLAPKICQFTHHTFSPGVTTTPVYAGLFDTTGAAVDDVVIAARALVYNRPTGATKCLWSAGLPFGGNSWATYSVYVIE